MTTRSVKCLGAASLVIVGTLVMPSVASADDCGTMQRDGTMDAVCADGKIIRGTLGVQVARLQGLDKSAARNGLAFLSSVDAAMISAFRGAPRFGESGFLLHDAFALDLALGYMTSDPLDDNDGPLVVGLSFGYRVLAGWAFPTASIAAGVDFEWNSEIFGSTSSTALLNGTRSIMVRGSYDGFIASAWKGALLGGDDRIGAEVDVPTSSQHPHWIAFRLDALPDQGYDLALGAGADKSNGLSLAATIGFRVCGSWAICR